MRDTPATPVRSVTPLDAYRLSMTRTGEASQPARTSGLGSDPSPQEPPVEQNMAREGVGAQQHSSDRGRQRPDRARRRSDRRMLLLQRSSVGAQALCVVPAARTYQSLGGEPAGFDRGADPFAAFRI